MKVAVVLTGHLRSFADTAPALMQHVVEPLGADVFIHTWDASNWLKGFEGDQIYSRAVEVYKPVSMMIDRARDFSAWTQQYARAWQHSMSFANTVSMWYSIREAMWIKCRHEAAQGFVYDAVIRLRPDLKLKGPIDPGELLRGNTLWLPNFAHYSGLNDQIAFGDSDVMNHYASLIENLETYNHSRVATSPENLAASHFMDMGCKIGFSSIDYDLIRAGGVIQKQDRKNVWSEQYWQLAGRPM